MDWGGGHGYSRTDGRIRDLRHLLASRTGQGNAGQGITGLLFAGLPAESVAKTPRGCRFCVNRPILMAYRRLPVPVMVLLNIEF